MNTISADTVFCTIATASHRPQALACLRSVRAFHPDARCVLLAMDDVDGVAEPGIEFMPVARCIESGTLDEMRKRYALAELCCATKPFLISHLLADGAAQVHYLDADCHVYATLAPLVETLSRADVLLTPHAFTPIPHDGRTPAALTVLRGGAFNAGYIGVRHTPEGLRFAGWHGEMTRRQARNAPAQGMCFDQRWLDLAPAMFPGLAICRDPGANVAYWNLHERTLTREDGAFTVNGAPLRFFHFSGWRAQEPQRVSVHQTRHELRDNDALREIFGEYAALLPKPAKAAWWKRA